MHISTSASVGESPPLDLSLMACTSTLWLSIHSTTGQLSSGLADPPEIDDVETPFLVHGIHKQEALSRSFCIATVRTHFCITLPHHSSMQERSNDLLKSNSVATWPYAPPCSLEASQHLQQALFDSCQSHKTDGTPVPAKRGLFIPPSEGSTSLDVLDSQDIVTSVMDLSDSLVDLHSIRPNQGQTITVEWTSLADAVLNEAPGTTLCARLKDALDDYFRVPPPSEDGDWVEV